MLTGIGSARYIDAYLAVNPASVAANTKADTSKYNKIQTKSAELVSSAKNVSQFLDRDIDFDHLVCAV